MPNAHATRILIENGRAVGVEFRTPRGLETARCRGEVIVSGGVYGSPQLLLLSGIGPGAHLREMGIAVRARSAAVGANLHDHFNSYRRLARDEGRHAQRSRPLARRASSRPASSMRSGGSGPLSGISTLAGILVRSDPRFDRPDLQINIFLWSIERRDRDGIYPHKWPGFSISPVHLRPEGRGRVSLKISRPAGAAEDRVQVPRDRLRRRRHALRRCGSARKIAEQPALEALYRRGGACRGLP